MNKRFDPQFWTKMARMDERIGLDLENKLKLTTQLPSNQLEYRYGTPIVNYNIKWVNIRLKIQIW